MNSYYNRFAILPTILVASLICAARSWADPLPGEQPKFIQLPLVTASITGQNYYGHDELSTAYGVGTQATPPLNYQGTFMADDFADKFSTPVVHITWWGSYLNAAAAPQPPVQRFLIAFESDKPVGPGNAFSTPNQVLQSDVVSLGTLAPGSGTFTETLVRGPDPVLGEALYKYNAELPLGHEFQEQPDTVYWLKIVALVDVSQAVIVPPPPGITQWGWHDRDYTVNDLLASTGPAVNPGEFVDGSVPGSIQSMFHFQDDAVQGDLQFTPGATSGPEIIQANMSPTHYEFINSLGVGPIDGPPGIETHSKDLAFELYTPVPEPASYLLLLLGFVGSVGRRRRRVA